MSNNGRPLKALKQLAAICRRHSIEPDESDFQLVGMTANIQTRYDGAKVLRNALADKDVALIQTGADGEWLAVIPFEKLLRFIEDAQMFQVLTENSKERTN
jgi:hypothetical protein